MAALLVGLSITAILMTVVMPVWKQMARREKEEELIFRGLQYARALRLFGTKYANASPPNLDVLVEQRFIRKKFKDPITNDDFQPVLAGQAMPGTSQQPPGGQQQGGNTSPFSTNAFNSTTRSPNSQAPTAPLGPGGRGTSPIGTPGAGATGGVIGVVSKSKDTSLRLYNGRSHYNEWAFINTPQTQAPGAIGGPGGRGRGGRGGTTPTGPGGPGSGPATTTSPFRPGPTSPMSPTSPSQPARPNQPARPIQPATRPK